MASLLYASHVFYEIMVRVINGKSNKERYDFVSREVGENKKVFELGCGTGMIKKFLNKSCDYIGWDLNNKFVKYAKRKGINVELRDVFDFQNYPECDVILIMDVLHHVIPNHVKLLKEAKKRCKKLILIEPYDSFSIIPNFRELKKSKGLARLFYSFINKIICDNDGINPPDSIFDWNHDEKSLRSFYKKNGVKKTIKFGPNIIGVF